MDSQQELDDVVSVTDVNQQMTQNHTSKRIENPDQKIESYYYKRVVSSLSCHVKAS